MRVRFELIGLRTVPKVESSSHVPASPNPSNGPGPSNSKARTRTSRVDNLGGGAGARRAGGPRRARWFEWSDGCAPARTSPEQVQHRKVAR